MKIVMLTPQSPKTAGGPASHVNNLSTELRRLGHSVWVLSTGSGDSSANVGKNLLVKNWKIFRRLAEIQPDVVHMHGRIHHIPVALVHRLFSPIRCKIVFSFHTQPYVRDFLDSTAKGRYDYHGIQRYVAKWLIHRCDEILSCSHSLINSLNVHFNFEIVDYTVLYTGTDLPQTDAQALLTLRADLNIDNCRPVLTSIGVFSWDWKVAGHQVCIEAISILKKKYPNIRLLIVGQGRFEDHLHRLVRERCLEKYVIFLGYTNHLREVLAISDIYVHMALNEAMGLSLVEAMHAKKPVIVANRGGLPELVENNVTGIVIEPSPDELAASTDLLWQNEGLQARLAENAHRFATESLNLNLFTQGNLEVYRRKKGKCE